MQEKIRWGILGPGNIARKFAAGLVDEPGSQLVAVGSRSKERAETFAEEFGTPNRHDSYEALAADPEVDAIYIATPHSSHMEHTLLCLEAGKAVLCEKPFAINAEQSRRMIDAARAKGVFLMEAMWTRFLPLVKEVRRRVANGDIGELRMLSADFGFRCGPNPEGRLMNPGLGGGGLLDVGIYPITLAYLLLGKPREISSKAHIGATGVDEQAAILLKWSAGELALLHTAVRTMTPMEAFLLGTEGRIHMLRPWWRGTKYGLAAGDEEQVFEAPFEGNGYQYEAAEVANCLREGKTESEAVPLDETLEIMEILDTCRAQWGLKYPME